MREVTDSRTDGTPRPTDGSQGPIVVVEGLVKDYGAVRAVDGLSFSIEPGEVFALLGPNGAGKTTTVEILEGHRHRSAGQVRVLGMDPQTGGRAYRERIGIVLQEAGFDEEFTVRELVSLYAGLYPRRRGVDEVIERVGLAEKAKARTKTLSGGQRRRLDLALGLVGDPELLFLDEPTTGFDPSARRRAWELVASLRELGTTIVLTTHYMEEAESLADRVAVIQGGRLVALDTPANLVAREGAEAMISFDLPEGVGPQDLPALGVAAARTRGTRVDIPTARPTHDLNALTEWALQRDLPLAGLTMARPTLEDVYLDLTEAGGDG
ncbi:MAG: ABC transporter ATP-binding protein [Candidatus Nanopelagicales bacterium]|jgi:ABC-2 type transport system ATP-binding protein|nr:ABC transporter ATP-binding protein [Candidatus Nanopelagicales bacterium]